MSGNDGRIENLAAEEGRANDAAVPADVPEVLETIGGLADTLSSMTNDSEARLPLGVIVGLAMATGIWCWIAIVDAIAGRPFHTFHELGGIAAFTIVHVLLNVVYGLVLVSVVRNAVKAPSLIIGLIFTFIIFEIAFGMLTVLLSNVGVGSTAWLAIFGGNAVGVAIAAAVLYRRYPLADVLHRAEAER